MTKNFDVPILSALFSFLACSDIQNTGAADGAEQGTFDCWGELPYFQNCANCHDDGRTP